MKFSIGDTNGDFFDIKKNRIACLDPLAIGLRSEAVIPRCRVQHGVRRILGDQHINESIAAATEAASVSSSLASLQRLTVNSRRILQLAAGKSIPL